MNAHICLEAINPDNNIYRFYNIYISQDLFSYWGIMINHGRIGRKGKQRQYFYPRFDAMEKKLRTILRRRSNATARIGCDYKPKSLQVAEFPEIQKQVSSVWPVF